jgi:hypothetical protein
LQEINRPSAFTQFYLQAHLSGIDAMSGRTSNDAFTFIGSSSNLTSANANGALWFDNGNLYGSNDADFAAEIYISLPNMGSMDTNHFIL